MPSRAPIGGEREPYAPFELTSDAARFGLITRTVSDTVGSCVARCRPVRRGDRATVFLHGAAGAWTTWSPVLEQAAADGIRIDDPVLIDLPGFGDATIAEDPRMVTVDEMAAMVELMLRSLGYTEWHVVGHSLGGFIALHMAATDPRHVLSVGMLSGTTFSVIDSVAHPARGMRELPAFTMLLAVMRVLHTLGRAGPAVVRVAGQLGLMRLIFAPLFRHGFRMPRSMIRVTSGDLRPAAFVAASEVTRGYDADRAWSGIRCEVRATRGDADVFVTPGDLERLRRVIPGTICTVIPDCGHFANVEHPARALAALGFVADEPRDSSIAGAV